MNSDRTQTGIPIIHCDTCRLYHPQGRRHCTVCGKPTLFINPNTGDCLKCEREEDQ